MTDMEEKAQRYEKRQRGIELKKRLATLGDRLQDHANEWNKLGKLFSEYAHPDITFAVEPDQFGLREFRVKKVHDDGFSHLPAHVSPLRTIVAVSLTYFDPSGLETLFRDIEEAKAELTAIRKFCAKIGDPLD
jgi:hypothetical protein